jgi:hypothetical protein
MRDVVIIQGSNGEPKIESAKNAAGERSHHREAAHAPSPSNAASGSSRAAFHAFPVPKPFWDGMFDWQIR